MPEPENHPTAPFNIDFCRFLEDRLSGTLFNFDEDEIARRWCDGILMPHLDSQVSKKSVNDNRKIITKAWIVYERKDFLFDCIILFGRKSLSRYARGLCLIVCVPGEEKTDWITIDTESKFIELRLQ